MLTADFDYYLPPELIAQHPVPERDQSRMMVLNRARGSIEHRVFNQLAEFLKEGDVLVLNDSKVIPARLRGAKSGSTTKFEMLLVEENSLNDWWTLLKPGKRLRISDEIILNDSVIRAKLLEKNSEGHCRLSFSGTSNVLNELNALGELPLPPYISRMPGTRSAEDLSRYQTVYARTNGSVAAPTAGLHITDRVLSSLRNHGVEIHFVTLHVGLGTFAPVKATELSGHVMHTERFVVPEETAVAINRAKTEKRRVIAVGTTSVRVLETIASRNREKIVAGSGTTNIFIHPPFKFQIVDALITNFHLPCSTLLMLVSAFASPGALDGREIILRTYAEAIRERYRFFSYGDAMLIL